MACVDYNMIKEGNLVILPEEGFLQLNSEQINSLYDGNIATTALTVSGSGLTKLAVKIEFGEAFDFCYLDYHTNETVSSRISLEYGTAEAGYQSSSFSLVSANTYRAEINTFARDVIVRHTVSGTVADVYGMSLIGQKNEVVGFGTSSAGQQEEIYVNNSPIGTTSSTPQAVPVYNDGDYSQTIRFSVAPTSGVVDSYIYLGTTSSGVFYGLNEYGFHQPGPNELALESDSFLSSEMGQHWERVLSSAPHKITPTQEGVILDILDGRRNPKTESLQTAGIITKDFFTAQSFTAEVEIRFLEMDPDIFESLGRDIFFILTNNYPIPDVGYQGSFQSDNRRGGLTAGISLRPVASNELASVDNMTYHLRVTDGFSTESAYSGDTESRWTIGEDSDAFLEIGVDDEGQIYEVEGPTLSEMEDIVYEGASFSDFTEQSLWHKWKMVYDHQANTFTCFVDNVPLGSYSFRVEIPNEGLKFFIGYQGNAGIRFQLRNFSIKKNVLYKQKNVAATRLGSTYNATISGTEVYKALDGDITTAYVAPAPTNNSSVTVSFDRPYNIVGYRLRQRYENNPITIYGETYYPETARTAIVTLGEEIYVHNYPSSESYSNESEVEYIVRTPTYVDSATTVSGISSLTIKFTNYDTPLNTPSALVISELEVLAEEEITVDAPTTVGSENGFPWINGRWRNLRQCGSAGSLAIRDKVSAEVCMDPFPEYTKIGVDYGFSSYTTDDENQYPFPETLFVENGDNELSEWRSDTQTDNAFWVWRAFSEHSYVKAVYWDSDTRCPNSPIADSFKIQYLVIDGDPNEESDWIDVPAINITHPLTTAGDDLSYKLYRDFLIANKSGNSYTNYYSRPSTTSFSIGTSTGPVGIVVPEQAAYFNTVNSSATASVAGVNGYVEFDSAIFTRAIRFYVSSVKDSGLICGFSGISSNAGETLTEFALSKFLVFRSNGAGSFESPVFDTGSRQNTERIFVDSVIPSETETIVFTRSFEDPPSLKQDTLYEVWQDLGIPGNSQIEFVDQPGVTTRAVVRDGVSYILLGAGSSDAVVPKKYTFSTDLWAEFDEYPGGGSSLGSDFFGETSERPSVLPDDRVTDNACMIDDKLYVSVYTYGDNVRNPRLMYYNFTGDFVGWNLVKDNRPSQTDFAIQVPYNDRIYYFARDGFIMYYLLDQNIWQQSQRSLPLYSSTNNRDRLGAVVWQGKVYLFGGRIFQGSGNPVGLKTTDVFNPETDEFLEAGTVSEAPYPLYLHQAVYVPEEETVYFLPQALFETSTEFYPTMKYVFPEDRWEVIHTMMYGRAVEHGSTGYFSVNDFYYYHDGYIYAHDALTSWSKTLVRRQDWESGTLPHVKDETWGSLPWKRVGAAGELMPQERYTQFRVELSSLDRRSSPVLNSVSLVIPQEKTIPANNSADIWLKIGISSSAVFKMWYGGEAISTYQANNIYPEDAYSILYTQSAAGSSWGFPTTLSGTYQIASNSYQSVRSPWVVENSIDDYQVWFSREVNGIGAVSPSIYYTTLSNASQKFAAAVQVIPVAQVAASSNGAEDPCIVKLSSSDYRCWYVGTDSSGDNSIIYSTSSNGVSWSGDQVVYSPGSDTVTQYDSVSVYKPCVIFDESIFKMWYTGEDSSGTPRILYSTSSDGIIWAAPQLSLQVASQGEFDIDGCSRAHVVKDSDTYYVYYFGHLGEETRIIKAQAVDHRIWADFSLNMPPYGIQSVLDGNGLKDIYVSVSRDPAIPGELITDGRIKLYDS
jgi:predicted GH43/DUF377 family glycosyl hydrolase